MTYKLVVMTGEQKGAHIMLRENCILFIGRGSDCDFPLTHAGVSRKHCQIWMQDGAIFIQDNKSANGTFVNSVRLGKPKKITLQDVIVISEVKLQLQTQSQIHIENKFDFLYEKENDGKYNYTPTNPKKAQQMEQILQKIKQVFNTSATMTGLMGKLLETMISELYIEKGWISWKKPKDGSFSACFRTQVENGQFIDQSFEINHTAVKYAFQNNKGTVSVGTMHYETRKFLKSELEVAEEKTSAGSSTIGLKMKFLLSVPLTGSVPIGVIYLDSMSQQATFDEEDLAMFMALGNRLGQAIEKLLMKSG